MYVIIDVLCGVSESVACAIAYMQNSEHNSQEPVLSVHHVGPQVSTQASSDKSLYLLKQVRLRGSPSLSPGCKLHMGTLMFTSGLCRLPQSNLQRHRKKCDPEHEKLATSIQGGAVQKKQTVEEGPGWDNGTSFLITLF